MERPDTGVQVAVPVAVAGVDPLAAALADVAGGIAAVAAGLCWTVKAVAILATGQQPALLFELVPLLMTFAILVLGQQLPPGRPRIVCTVVGTAALLAGVTVLTGQVMSLPTVAYGIAMAGANLLILVGLVTAGLRLRRLLGAHLPLWLGLVTVPALLIGGLAAELVGEPALEVPLATMVTLLGAGTGFCGPFEPAER